MSRDDITATETPDERIDDRDSGGETDGLPAIVDWVLGVAVALGGTLALLVGTAIGSVLDRDTIAEALDDEDVTATIGSSELTPAEATDVAEALLSWLEIGLLVTGAGMLVAAAGYVVKRRRVRARRRPGEPLDSFGTHALLGAVVAAVLSFVPFATGLGGAVAGYFEQPDSGRSVSVGAVSGVLLLVPILVITAFVLVGLIEGLREIGQGGDVGFVAATVLFSVVFGAAFAGGLGAVGGFVGGKIAED